MRALLALLLAIHGAIHALGFVKAFGLAEVPQLHEEIGRKVGLLWLAAGILLVGAALMLLTVPRLWWLPALTGVVLSQALIVGAWGDARFGTVANAIVLVPLLVTLADFRPSSLRSRYLSDVRSELTRVEPSPPLLDEANLADLPPQVATYLRRTGVVGRPRVRSFRVEFRARMRGGPDERWMPATAEQYELFDPPARFFFMKAVRAGVPFDVYHRYVGDAATMQVRVIGLFPVVDEAGPVLTRSETVTLLNDMFFFAPAVLVEAPIDWEIVDGRTVRATWANAGHTVSALVYFDEAGDLVDFRSDDRWQIDGKDKRLLPWTTPVTRYGTVGDVRLAVEAEARWMDAGGAWTYGEFVVEGIEYNVSGEDAPHR
jgi:hypothetical protein